jgi:hypothetical protein
MARASYRQLNHRARCEATKRMRDRAFEQAMLSIRGGFEPPAYVLKRMRPCDLAVYLARRERAGQ